MRNKIRRISSYAGGEGLGSFLVRAVAGSGAVQLGGMLVTFMVGVLLARTLGAEGYGYYGVAMAIVAVASIPGEFGLPQLVTREVATASARQQEGRLHGVLRWANRTSLLFALIAAGCVALLATFVPERGSAILTPALMLGAPIIPLVALTRIRGAALQGLHFVTLGQLPDGLLRPLFFALLLLGMVVVSPTQTVAQAVALNSIAAAAALIIAHLLLRRRLRRPAHLLEESASRDWLASAFPMAMTEGMRVLQFQLAILLVGIMTPPEEAGLFRVAMSTVGMIAVPITLINTVSAPVLAQLYTERDVLRLRKLSSRAALAMTIGVALLILPFVVFGPPLIAFVFGTEFAPAYPALIIMALGQLVSAIFGPNATLLNMTGHEKRVTRAMLIALTANVALVLLLVPIIGHVGAAWATAAGVLAWNIATWRDSRRLIGVDTSLLPVGMPRAGQEKDA